MMAPLIPCIFSSISSRISLNINSIWAHATIQWYRCVSFNRTPINRNSRYNGHFPWEHSQSIFSITIYRKFRFSDALHTGHFRTYIRISCARKIFRRFHTRRYDLVSSGKSGMHRTTEGTAAVCMYGLSRYLITLALCYANYFLCVVSYCIFVLSIVLCYNFLFCYFFL